MNNILALYDEQQRVNVTYYGARFERTPEVVRMVDETGWHGMVLHSRLDENNADRAIEEQIAFFEGIGQDFEWKYFSHDTPPDLRDRLAAHGFEIEEAETIMALEIDHAPAVFFEPVTADIRRLTDAAQMGVIVRIMDEVWDDDHTALGEMLADELSNHGDYFSMYVAYVDSLPASAAWIRFHDGRSQFAELLGGSTLAAYRKRGLYTALLSTRVQEAKARGVRYLTIDASPMSQPIVTKHGFQMLTVSNPCTWKVKKHPQEAS